MFESTDGHADAHVNELRHNTVTSEEDLLSYRQSYVEGYEKAYEKFDIATDDLQEAVILLRKAEIALHGVKRDMDLFENTEDLTPIEEGLWDNMMDFLDKMSRGGLRTL